MDRPIPRGVKQGLGELEKQLDDIAGKVSRLADPSSAFTLKVNVAGIDKMAELNRTIERSKKLNKQLASNLGERIKTETALMQAIAAQTNKIKESNKEIALLNKKKGELNKKDEKYKKDLEEIEDRIDDYNKSIQHSNKIVDEENEKLGRLDSNFKVIAKTLANQTLGALDKLGKGLTVLALDSVIFSFEKLKEGFMSVYDLFERTTKAVGKFNLAFGGATKGLDSTRKEAWKVEGTLRSLTGGPLGVGLEMWQETSQALGFVGKGFDEITTTATLAGRGLGMGGQAAGELARTLTLMGTAAGDVKHDLVQVSDSANDAGISVAAFGKEIAASKNFMAQFGRAGKKVFLDSASFARKLGLSLQSLQKFTDMTDSFESTAQAAAKMNVVFGTSINALDLMLEQDPSKRLEMVRKQFKEQGKTWEGMSRQERKFFAQTMQLSEEEAAAVLENGMTLEQFHKQQEQDKKKQLSDDAKIRNGLVKTAETLFNFGQAWDGVTQSIAKLIAPFLKVFGLIKDGDEKSKTFGQNMKSVFGTLMKFIDSLANDPQITGIITEWATDFKDLAGRAKEFFVSGEAKKWFKEASDGVSHMYGLLKSVAKTIDEKILTDENKKLAHDIFGFVSKNIGKIVGGYIALKGVIGAGTIISGINSTVKLVSGGSGLISVLGNLGKSMASFAGEFLPTLASGVKKSFDSAVGVISKSLGTIVGGLKTSIGELSGSIGGKAGLAAGVLAAAAAGWEFGTKLREWFPQIDQYFQAGLDGITKMLDKLWSMVVHTTIYRRLFGDEDAAAYDKKAAEEAAYNNTMARDAIAKALSTVTGNVAPAPVAVKSTPAVIRSSTPTNYVAAPQSQNNSQDKTITIIAGDVYLDADKVGRHMARTALSK